METASNSQEILQDKIPSYSIDEYGNCRHAWQGIQKINNNWVSVCQFCDEINPDEL